MWYSIFSEYFTSHSQFFILLWEMDTLKVSIPLSFPAPLTFQSFSTRTVSPPSSLSRSKRTELMSKGGRSCRILSSLVHKNTTFELNLCHIGMHFRYLTSESYASNPKVVLSVHGNALVSWNLFWKKMTLNNGQNKIQILSFHRFMS